VVTAAIAVLLWVARPQLSPMVSRVLGSRDPRLTISDLAGSRTAVRGADYSLDLRASGGSPPLSWGLQEGTLPRGLTLDPATGRIAGNPDTIGTYSFQVRTADAAGLVAQRAITIEVIGPSGSVGDPGAGRPASGGAGATCKASAFNLDQYGDLLTGELTWTGALPAGGQLEIRNLVASPGSVQGEIFPKGAPVRIFVTPARIRVVTAPTAENCWDPRLVLENPGNPKSAIKVRWEVFQP
jgi:hypothetical protein